MATLTSFKAKIWLQPDGCGTDLYPLDCAWPESFSYGESAKEKAFCYNNGVWEEIATLETVPETIEFTLVTKLESAANRLDTAIVEGVCQLPFYVVLKCIRQGEFQNWDILFRVENASAGPVTIDGFTDLQSTDAILTKTYTFSVAQTNITPIWRLNDYAISNAIYAFDLNAVDFCQPDVICTTDCDDVGLSGCETAAISGDNDGVTGAFALTLNETCSAIEFKDAVNPLVSGITDGVAAVLCVEGTDTQIWALTLGTPADLEVVVVEDEGLPVTVTVSGGGGNPTGPNTITADHVGGVHIVGGDGYIYRSLDRGITWETTDAGVASGGAALNAVKFRSNNGVAGGFGGVIVGTSNNGESWTGVVQTDITADIVAIDYNDENYYFFTTDGKMYTSPFGKAFTEFTEYTIPGTSGNTLVDAVVDGCTIVAVYNKAAGSNPGSIVESVNGGASWEPVITSTNTGYNAIARQGNGYVVVGDGGTAQKLSRVLR